MSTLYKYPHTPHLPQSRSRTNDDHVLTTAKHFDGKHVVVTEKRDGESCSMYRDHYHARSLDSRHHGSRDWIKAFHATIKHEIPLGWRVCGENLYAQHSIRYDDLDTYFEGFSVWNIFNHALSWDHTLEWFELLGITPVPVMYVGTYSDEMIEEMISRVDIIRQEGFVVRVYDSFAFEDFGKSVAKWVRPKHVQTDEHWMAGEIVPNGLKEN